MLPSPWGASARCCTPAWRRPPNVWITGVLVLILPTAVALLLLPPLAMPLVCAVFARLHGDLSAREEASQSRSDMSSTKR
ncbi:hypothetical protein [Streptomyces sp. NPDC050546]|uniref:hypothetical protein n=1 Tax=Streptomyces sp. NPDC050546 TaxID=3365628 RepID=UPI0037A53ED2